MDYTQITVRDMCYFLNGRADKSHNEELFMDCSPEDFPDSEMYLFIQQKSNNFNDDLLEYLIFDIRTHPVQYAMKINDDFVDIYDIDLSKSNLKLSSKPGEKLHEAIERDMNDNKELILYSDQIIVFSKIAEKIFNKPDNIDISKKTEASSTKFESDNQKREKITALLEVLKPYFANCSSTDLETIIEHKQLPIGREQILWNGSKADAIRFIEHFKITKAQFNKIFYFLDMIKLHQKHKDKTDTLSNISDILNNYHI